ncbi:helix-turn-helix domain-containing protein [Paenibacillus sp. Lou8.1]|uniref:helix-turn-helix domain-containing protein n=1 Tax=Paenibacillus sp. Lou8.1 TaxID=2962041 RepID=UPI0020B725AA|nr:helix-turn-helix transcriptional regulator [Paenibacillus sp. Lou8.1]MCP3810076.1 helix-turn-helix domain-containing protein [Paenibacillus sp. Lou8.1]
MDKRRNNITYLRLRNILSQKDVAETLGISQVYYGRLEKNPEKISLGMASKLKTLFKVDSIDELLEEVV